MVLISRQGEKMYPVCSWEKHQHKLYNIHNITYLWCLETNWSDEALFALNKVERAIEAFDNGRYKDGIVYATKEDIKLIRKYIADYDTKH